LMFHVMTQVRGTEFSDPGGTYLDAVLATTAEEALEKMEAKYEGKVMGMKILEAGH
jgi:hypothetical protein